MNLKSDFVFSKTADYTKKKYYVTYLIKNDSVLWSWLVSVVSQLVHRDSLVVRHKYSTSESDSLLADEIHTTIH
jgi:hypothetical protein